MGKEMGMYKRVVYNMPLFKCTFNFVTTLIDVSDYL